MEAFVDLKARRARVGGNRVGASKAETTRGLWFRRGFDGLATM